jgi:hypothetical protein
MTAEKNEWEILDDLGKCITELVDKSHKAHYADRMSRSLELLGPTEHTAFKAKDLVNQLKSAMVKSLTKKNSLPDSINQALNEGKGVYRP